MKGKVRVKIPWFFEAEVEFEIGFNKRVKKVAWELYCELSTRVGVIDFVPDEDNIVKCLDSWYEFFKYTREKIKSLDPPKRKKKSKKDAKIELIDIILALLNEQLRPFLRKWHGKFRHYWEYKAEKEKYPVEQQKEFEDYPKLLKKLQEMQEKLKDTADALYIIAIS